ncbi:MAG TPA: tRNA (adenosine(37)-N6)-threonylcarbamoyltransferase complex transferase subunit TsaD [Candidatus Saccharimonadales bacterium]|nr:tRNA (adenosine(37)-N6)-threonylcarbamoyltransferase complex transferase subunit TsaD [Candidatus Saccharimonadales bacterium]
MHKNNLTILGIESSCDETAAAVYSTQQGLLSNELFSQIPSHALIGGVIPETASREHMEKIVIITQQALSQAHKTLDDIDVFAVTCKPGLPGALMVGVAFAKALAFATNKKLIGIDHLEGHVFSACIENNVPFPFLALTVSGGHSAFYLVHDFGSYKILGSTLDDAAGEAFDKIAKLMNLPYPGGPVIEKLAQEVDFKDFFCYPRGNMKNLNFSFSGLKTAVLYHLVAQKAYDQETKTFLKDDDLEFKQQVASSLLVCIGDIFEEKIMRALKIYPELKSICFVGGVACNKYLRNRLQAMCEKQGKQLFYPSNKLCTDNAGMIAFVGQFKAQQCLFDSLDLKVF